MSLPAASAYLASSSAVCAARYVGIKHCLFAKRFAARGGLPGRRELEPSAATTCPRFTDCQQCFASRQALCWYLNPRGTCNIETQPLPANLPSSSSTAVTTLGILLLH